MENPMILTNAKGDQIPLSLRWGDQNDIDEENFIVVKSKKKRDRKVNVVISKPVTRSQKNHVSLLDKKGNPTLPPSRITRRGKNNTLI